MIRCTEHTARGTIKSPCAFCKGAIKAGDCYRQLVMVREDDIVNKSYYRDTAHSECVSGSQWWELRRPDMRSGLDLDCAYVRGYYGLDVRAGMIVYAGGKLGTVAGGTHHIWVRLEGAKRAQPYHPNDVRRVDTVAVEVAQSVETAQEVAA